MDSPVDLPSVLLWEFSSGVVSPLVWAAVVVAGLLFRWHPLAVRAAAAAVGLARGLTTAWSAGLGLEAAFAVTGALVGALVVAELTLAVIVPVVRFVWTCFAVAVDVAMGVIRHLLSPSPPRSPSDADNTADDPGREP